MPWRARSPTSSVHSAYGTLAARDNMHLVSASLAMPIPPDAIPPDAISPSSLQRGGGYGMDWFQPCAPLQQAARAVEAYEQSISWIGAHGRCDRRSLGKRWAGGWFMRVNPWGRRAAMPVIGELLSRWLFCPQAWLLEVVPPLPWCARCYLARVPAARCGSFLALSICLCLFPRQCPHQLHPPPSSLIPPPHQNHPNPPSPSLAHASTLSCNHALAPAPTPHPRPKWFVTNRRHPIAPVLLPSREQERRRAGLTWPTSSRRATTPTVGSHAATMCNLAPGTRHRRHAPP